MQCYPALQSMRECLQFLTLPHRPPHPSIWRSSRATLAVVEVKVAKVVSGVRLVPVVRAAKAVSVAKVALPVKAASKAPVAWLVRVVQAVKAAMTPWGLMPQLGRLPRRTRVESGVVPVMAVVVMRPLVRAG